jgi:hypothetical protein
MIPSRLWIFLTGVRVFYRDNLEQDALRCLERCRKHRQVAREGKGKEEEERSFVLTV